MQDLTWIKSIFENYKKKYSQDALRDGLCNISEHLYKPEAADEILEAIKNFIKESNKLVGQQKDS